MQPSTRLGLSFALALTLLAGCGLGIAWGYVRALAMGASRREVGLAAAYLAVQTLSVIPGVLWTGFYVFVLAVHYAEYHLLMFPRWQHAELDSGGAADRGFARIRARPMVLYAVLVVLAGVGLTLRNAGHDPQWSAVFLVHAFDGLFVFHYVIEMFLWKFSDPYWRSRLAPLYVGTAR